MLNRKFQLFLFTVDPCYASLAKPAGIDGLVVDWERRGKPERQSGFDTQISADSPEDLARVRRAFAGTILCRINEMHPGSKVEIEAAIAGGADEILLPMVRNPEEVQAALDLVRGRTKVGILLETQSALDHLEDFSPLPLARLYVGLNDLAIERQEKNIFRFLLEDSMAEIRRRVSCPFGFGGLTLPELGSPLPCRLLMGEMAKLQVDFSFLRRSFLRDVPPESFADAIPKIRSALLKKYARSSEAVEDERKELVSAILHLNAGGKQ